MSTADWDLQPFTGMAAMIERLGLDLAGVTPCRHAPASAIDLCHNCPSRDVCYGWLAPEDAAPDDRPAFCPKAQRLADLIADLEFVARAVMRH